MPEQAMPVVKLSSKQHRLLGYLPKEQLPDFLADLKNIQNLP